MKKTILNRYVAATFLAATAWNSSAQTCIPINQIPFPIVKPGNYCLTQSLSSTLISGAAISVNASDVHIDLSGYLLDGSAAGANSTAQAIVYDSRERGLRVFNGRIRGFDAAINAAVYATNPNATHFEDLRIEASRNFALNVVGDHSIVRRVVIDGVTSRSGQSTAVAIFGSGNRQRFLDNDIAGVAEPTNGTGAGISCSACSGAMFENNRIAGGVGAGLFTAIFAGPSSVVRRNSLHNADRGVFFSSTGSKFQDNVTTAVTSPFIGNATDAGGNN